ncbi:MAG TPA: isoprenylcysteine carboxylmethyltransferase family protein [Lacipirellulaceae bacterium]|jgi:protein-S-isoprenylcysteine O-methyltransferase Ste14|nr:isoprenylcysteine carboxylmethyltransferase family protein [Lacipirellulaceae bacterium]
MANSSRTAVGDVGRVTLFVALLIFVPAWSLDYWEAWQYLLLFAATMGLLKWYLVRHDPALAERRRGTGPKFETERSQQIIQSFGGALICAIFITSGIEHRVHGSVISPAAVLVANGFLLASMYIVFYTFRENSFAASTVRIEAEQPVISTGPYAWVRHPMYFGCVIGFLATPIALGSLWGLAAAALKCVTLGFRLLYEEEFLVRSLPGYDAYLAKVRWRLVPFVW